MLYKTINKGQTRRPASSFKSSSWSRPRVANEPRDRNKPLLSIWKWQHIYGGRDDNEHYYN